MRILRDDLFRRKRDELDVDTPEDRHLGRGDAWERRVLEESKATCNVTTRE